MDDGGWEPPEEEDEDEEENAKLEWDHSAKPVSRITLSILGMTWLTRQEPSMMHMSRADERMAMNQELGDGEAVNSDRPKSQNLSPRPRTLHIWSRPRNCPT